MGMFSFLFLLLQLSVEPDKITNQAELYYGNIESGHEVAVSTWALSRLYQAADSAHQQRILGLLDNEFIHSALNETHDEFSSISRLNEKFHNEELLLYLLLQSEDPQKREKLYESFYESNRRESQLREFNRQVVDGETIDSGLLHHDQFTFPHFLIEYYDLTLDSRNADFFDSFTDFWIDNIDQVGANSLISELHIFTIFNSAYKARNYEQVPSLYDRLTSINSIPYSVILRNLYWDLEFAHYQLGYVDKSIEVQREHLIPIENTLEIEID